MRIEPSYLIATLDEQLDFDASVVYHNDSRWSETRYAFPLDRNYNEYLTVEFGAYGTVFH